MRAELVSELDESGIDVVVVLDEIDRLDEREVAVVARLVRLVANFERFSYLLAYDPDRIAGALGKNDGDSGRAALETLVHLQVTLPPALPRQVRRLVSQRFGELVDEPDDHQQRLSQLLSILVPGILGTLRDAKRLIAGFEMLHRRLRLEVDEVDLLGWAAIQTKFPEIEQIFRHRQEQILGLASNLFGDILSDIASQLAGGIGLAPSANLHPGRVSMFEPVHGSAPPLAGKNVANPMGAILSAGLMLDELGFAEEARRIERAIEHAIRENVVTADLGGVYKTDQIGDWICRNL